MEKNQGTTSRDNTKGQHQGINVLWQAKVHSDVAFDPPVLALAILALVKLEVALLTLCFRAVYDGEAKGK